MSIDKIQSNKLVQFPNKLSETNSIGHTEKALFEKELKNAQLEDKKMVFVDKTIVIQNPSNILPIQTNHHVLSRVPLTYTSEQLHRDAWNYMIDGKVPTFTNQHDKTKFALKFSELNMFTKGLEL